MPGLSWRDRDAEVSRLVTELLDAATAQGWSLRAFARAAGIGESVPNAWRSARSAPRLGSALNAGFVVRLRLDWEPTDDNAAVEMTETPPSATWRTYRRSATAELDVDPEQHPVIYAAALIGAELHWRRTQEHQTSLYEAGGVSHGTWWALERGLKPTTGAQDQLLRSYVAAGAEVDLRLVWLPQGPPWRTGPWQHDAAIYKKP